MMKQNRKKNLIMLYCGKEEIHSEIELIIY